MTVPKVLTIDASALSDVDFNSYINDFFATLAADSNDFYGGLPDYFYGSPYNVSGSQVLATYTEDGNPSAAVALIEGSTLAYDFIHYGMAYGHGISGEIDRLTFGRWVEGETTGTQGIGVAGEVSGLGVGLVIEGLDLSAAAGSGTNTATNLVYGVYKALNSLDADYLYDLMSAYSIEFTGTSGNDAVAGFRHADLLMGGDGNDALRGGGGNDILVGGTGNDLLAGNGGADILRGGGGADRLVGGGGRDVLFGGEGSDTFVIRAIAGDLDIIADFNISEDLLNLRALGLGGLDDLTITETAKHLDLFTGTQTVRLEGLSSADLADATILF